MTNLGLRSGAFEIRVTDADPTSLQLSAGTILHARCGCGESTSPAWPAAMSDKVRRVECLTSGQVVATCLVRYHCLVADLDAEDALLVGHRLLLLVDDSVMAFDLPSLRIAWRSLVAEGIPWCFRIIKVPDRDRVLVHCEWEVGCLDLAGNRVWHTSEFADILTGPAHVDGDAYVVEDFSGWRYRVALDSGATSLVHRPESQPRGQPPA